MADFLRVTWIVAQKDLAIEFRTRAAFVSATVFSVLSMTVFSFTWNRAAVASTDFAPGLLWVIFVFSTVLGLHRSFGVELEGRALDGVLASPADRRAVFYGKMLANLVFVAGVQAVSIPALAIFFNLPLTVLLAAVAGVAFLAAIGLVAVGTLFSSMSANTRLAELLLPLLLLPFAVPVVIPAAQATSQIIGGNTLDGVGTWLKLLAAFDIVFVAACAALFPYTLDD